MNQPGYRPPSVWITQILLLLSLIAAIVALLSRFQCSSTEQLFNCTSSITIHEFLISLLMNILACLTIWGLQKRQHYGKWLAVGFLTGAIILGMIDSPLLWSLRVIFSIIPNRGNLPNPLDACNHPFGNLTYLCGYESYQELGWKIISDLLPFLILGFLAFRLLYSHAAKRFFHK
jgi:hypothetical protein